MHSRAHLLLHELESDVEHRHEEEQGECADDHAAHYARSERTVSVGASAGREHERKHTEDHRQHCHQDRAEAHLRGRIGGLDDAHALAASLDGILGDEDCRLGQQPDEHDDTGLEVDVVLQPEELREEEAAHQSTRHGEDDGEGDEEALVEAGEDEVDEHHADAVDEERGCAAALRFLARDAAVFVAITLRQSLLGHLLDGAHSLAGGVTVGYADVGRDGGVEIETRSHLGAHHLFEGDELADGRHLRAVADVETVERLLVQAILGVGLHHDAIDLAVLVEVGDVRTAAVGTKDAEHGGGRDAGAFALGGVHIDAVLREVHGVRGVSHRDLGALVEGAEVLHDGLVELRHVAARLVLKVQADGVAHAVTGDHTRLEGEDLRLLDGLQLRHQLAQHGVRAVRAAFAFAPILEADDEHAV